MDSTPNSPFTIITAVLAVAKAVFILARITAVFALITYVQTLFHNHVAVDSLCCNGIRSDLVDEQSSQSDNADGEFRKNCRSRLGRWSQRSSPFVQIIGGSQMMRLGVPKLFVVLLHLVPLL